MTEAPTTDPFSSFLALLRIFVAQPPSPAPFAHGLSRRLLPEKAALIPISILRKSFSYTTSVQKFSLHRQSAMVQGIAVPGVDGTRLVLKTRAVDVSAIGPCRHGYVADLLILVASQGRSQR